MLKPFRALNAGKVLDQTDGVAELWIHCGRAERMIPETTVTVDAQPAHPRRGRRTKQRQETLV
jgi:hypothetical protein